MKLAIAAMGTGLDAPVDLRFGRARGFVVVDTDTGSFLSLDNGGENRVWQGAGFQTAEMLIRHGVEAVLTGRFGPNALQALRTSGIRAYAGLAGGSVRQALEQFLAGSFQEASSDDVREEEGPSSQMRRGGTSPHAPGELSGAEGSKMPRGDCTGPMESSPMTGRGMGRGGGRGRQGGFGLGPEGDCVCPKCGKTVPHERGVPCYQAICPDCGTNMTRKF